MDADGGLRPLHNHVTAAASLDQRPDATADLSAGEIGDVQSTTGAVPGGMKGSRDEQSMADSWAWEANMGRDQSFAPA